MGELVTRPRAEYPANPASSVNLEKEKAQFLQTTNKDFYFVTGGKRVPSAKVIREWVKNQGIHIEIIDYGKDKEHAWAHVRGYRKEDPLVTREAVVIFVFADELVRMTFDAIDNGLQVGKNKVMPAFDIGEEGWPILRNQEHQFQLLRNYLRKRQFSEREAVTKAESIVFLKLMGIDNPDHDEPEQEEDHTEQQELQQLQSAIRAKLIQLHDGEKQKAIESFHEIMKRFPGGEKIVNTTDIISIEMAEAAVKHIDKLLTEKNKPKGETDKPEEQPNFAD